VRAPEPTRTFFGHCSASFLGATKTLNFPFGLINVSTATTLPLYVPKDASGQPLNTMAGHPSN